MNYILFDGPNRENLLPFTFTRPVADIRVGILTIREKWEKRLGVTTTTVTEDYLEEKYPMVEMEDNIMIHGAVLPNDTIVQAIENLKEGQLLSHQGAIIAFYTKSSQETVSLEEYETIEFNSIFHEIANTWDIFSINSEAIKEDFLLLTEGRSSAAIPDTITCFSKENIFIEEGATLLTGTLNASDGPIYIGKNATVMEGALVRGPFALCESSTLKMGVKIYGGTTIGPHSKVGGEVNNSVIFGFSNKGHDGFLGNSVIGEWCNLGADTNNSNLKNNYAEVRLWNYGEKRFTRTGLQFCGLMMGDHSKCGINTMFNTGTVIGISANIFGGNFPRNYIPSFSWGGSAGFTEYKMNKVNEVAEAVMKRRNLVYSDQEKSILQEVFERTQENRNF